MNEIIGITLITIISSATLTALLCTLIYLIPQRVEQTREVIAQSLGRTFLVGLVNALFFGVLAAIFANGGDIGGLIALLILLALAGLAAIGLSSIVVILRNRLYPEMSGNGLKDTMKTAVLLIIAGLTPFIGWFALAPILLLIGLGAAITTLVRRKKAERP